VRDKWSSAAGLGCGKEGLETEADASGLQALKGLSCQEYVMLDSEAKARNREKGTKSDGIVLNCCKALNGKREGDEVRPCC